MPDYYYTATDRNTRKRETSRIEAASAQEALRQLEAAELDEIVLHTDDVAAAVSKMMPSKVSINNDFTASDYVSLRTTGDFGFFLYLTKTLYWQGRWGLLFCAGLALFAFLQAINVQRPYAKFASVFFLIVCLLPPVIALYATLFSPTRKFNQIQEDFYWGRWNEVLRRLPRVCKHLPLIEARGREAASLAGLGRLDEALHIMAPLADQPDIPRWMYLSRLAEVYEYAEQMEQCLALRKEAYEAEPENSVLKLGYANTLLKLNLDPPLADQLIAEVETEPLSDLLQVLLPISKGQLELNLGYYQNAFFQFMEAENGLKPYVSTQPFARLYADVARAYAAIALAEQGELEQAELLFQSARPRLEALKSRRTIDRYHQALSR